MTPALTEKITALVTPLLASLGLDLWGLEFIPAQRSVLRLYIEAGTGAGINECEKASRLIGLALDVEDALPSAYVLEVSTPGLDRPLFTPDQLAAQLGRVVEIQLTAALESFPGRKKFSGALSAAVPPQEEVPWNFCLRLGETDTPISFSWPQVKKARVLHLWPEKTGGPNKKRPMEKQKKLNSRSIRNTAGETLPPGGQK